MDRRFAEDIVLLIACCGIVEIEGVRGVRAGILGLHDEGVAEIRGGMILEAALS